MEKTKHDLSFDSTKLDFEALTQTAAIAYASTRRHVENALGKLQRMLKSEEYENAGFPLKAQWLAEDAERLAIAASTYYTLLCAKSRKEISIINKPQV